MVGTDIYKLAERIFPIYRHLTGDGVRQTLKILSDYIEENTGEAIEVHNIPSGTHVFDWVVPKEWKIQEGYIETETGERIIDFKKNNLHVVGYSAPIDKWVTLRELYNYVYVQEDQPDVIPYVTSYYKECSGFCMAKNQRDSLINQKYHMVIESELYDGNLTYGEVVLKGNSCKEIFFSTYICHPSMANNECSGPALMSEIIRYVSEMKNRRFTYRFVFIPETIGSIAYMATDNHLEAMKQNVVAGYNLTCVGDNYNYSLIHSRYSDTIAEKTLKLVLEKKENFHEYSFRSRGSDERQYNAPGIDLPIITFCRTKFHEYKEYHTSADDLSFISPMGFQGSFDAIAECIGIIEINGYYRVNTLGEPQLGKRGLYPTLSKKGSTDKIKNMLDIIAYMDGKNDLIDLSVNLNIDINEVLDATKKLISANLIERIG